MARPRRLEGGLEGLGEVGRRYVMESSLFVHPGFMQAASEELPGEGSGGVRARFLGLGAAAQGPGRARGDLACRLHME